MALTQQQRDQYITSLLSRTGPISIEQAKQNWDSMNTEGGGASWDDMYARLNAKSDADLIGSATAHGQHLESDARGGNALERALQSPWTYVLPGLGLSAAGMGWVGTGLGATAGETLAPWGTGEAVSGAYAPTAAELGGAGAGADAGMDWGMYNPNQANPYVTGASGAGATAATNAAAGGAATGATTVGTAATGTALSRILSGSGTTEDYLTLGGQALPAVLSAFGSAKQADAYKDLSQQYLGLGAPSRARYEASFQPGFDLSSDPGYQGTLDQSAKATLHGLSVQGNPAGSPNAWAQSLQDLYAKTAYPALQNYRNMNANAGGIASLQTAAPAAATGAIGAQGSVYSDLGYGLGNVFNPKPTLAQLLGQYKSAGIF